jgi:hypothetical protein
MLFIIDSMLNFNNIKHILHNIEKKCRYAKKYY